MDNQKYIKQNAAKGADASAAEPKKGAKRKRNWLPAFLGGDLLQSKVVLRQWKLVFLIAFFAMILVHNRYKVEDLTKAKIAAQDRINYLRESRIELQKRYQETIKISRIADRLDSTGVGITAGPPFEI